MDQTMQYRQLQPDDRMTKPTKNQQGLSARVIARALRPCCFMLAIVIRSSG